MTERSVALIRGINVGRSVRIGMADLREVVGGLGATNVRTYLQSGNVVYEGRLDAAALEQAIEERWGIAPRVLVLTAAEFRAVADGNPLREVATDPSRMFVTFFETVPVSLDLPTDLGDEQLVLGEHGMYNWIPGGALDTKVPARFTKGLGLITVRNLRTVDTLREWLDA
jgi:uncharacterized protein (DUF1697 family)